MYTIDDLNVRLLSELKEIAEGMGVKNAKKLSKQDLIYKILDQQAVSPEAAPAPKKASVPSNPPSESSDAERKMRPRRRENVAPAAPKPEMGDGDFSSDELLDSINLDFNSPTVANFENQGESDITAPIEEQQDRKSTRLN